MTEKERKKRRTELVAELKALDATPKSDWHAGFEALLRIEAYKYGDKIQIRTHVDSLLKMMSALTGDDRFEQIINERKKGERKVRNMCEVLDRAERKGERRGEKKGIKEGVLTTLSNLVNKKIITVEVAAEEAHMSVSRFKKLADIQ